LCAFKSPAKFDSLAAIDAWIKGLEAEMALQLERVIAGHFAKNINCDKILGNALAYIKAYREAVADNVFMVYWLEANGMAVVHVQNWNTKDVWTNI